MKIFFRNKKCRLVNFYLFLNVGAVDDSIPGIAHFLEHILLSSRNKYIQQINLLGVDINGYTTQNGILLFAKVLKKDLVKVLEILINGIFNYTFSDDIVESERNTIFQEIEFEPRSREKEIFIEALSLCSNVKFHDEKGTKENISKINRLNLKDFYERYIVNENSALFIDGRLGNFIKLKIKKFDNKNKLKFGTNELKTSILTKRIDADIDADLCHLFLLIKNDGQLNLNKVLYELFLISMFSPLSKFWKKTREIENLCYYIDYENIFIKNTGFSVVQVDTKKENEKKVADMLMNFENLSEEDFFVAKKTLEMLCIDDFERGENVESFLYQAMCGFDNSMKNKLKRIKKLDYKTFIEFIEQIKSKSEYMLLVEK